MLICEPGDILMYRHGNTLDKRLIDFGERLEDGAQSPMYYHVAIALGPNLKIEAQGKSVAIDTIDYGNFDPYRPPLSAAQIHDGLTAVKKCVGQPYDWWLIINDALSYLTHGIVHLPTKWIESEERKSKICSSLAALYFKAAGLGVRWALSVSPEDIFLAVKEWPAT